MKNKTAQSKGCISRPAVADTASRLCLCFLEAFPTCSAFCRSCFNGLWPAQKRVCGGRSGLGACIPAMAPKSPPSFKWGILEPGRFHLWVNFGPHGAFFGERFTGKPVSPLSVSVNYRNPGFLLPQMGE